MSDRDPSDRQRATSITTSEGYVHPHEVPLSPILLRFAYTF